MSSSHRILILLAFAVSGCAGLIYESVWSHYLGLYLGHAAFAQTLTLGIFMGGMTIGALAISRYTYKIKNALTAYAIAELILGVLGLLFHSIFVEFIAFSYDSVFPNLNSSSLIEIYKWFSASLIILPQSIVLGATFPLLCSALIRREQQGTGRHISMLYFSNSIGAAAGALIATFVLLPLVGMPGALLTSGLINISVAILAYYLAKQPEQKSSAVQKDKPAETTTASYIVLVAALITGAVSFMYEIAWIRMLNLILGTSLHAFEIMLSAFILGLALGGWWIKNRIDQIQNLLRFNGIVQICMGLAAISTLSLYVQSFDWVSTLLKETLRLTDTGYIFYNITTSIISGLIMIPATFCAGMTLPLLTTHLIRTSKSESAIGRVYASNTIGAIIGIVFAVHIGMTVLGLKWLIITAGLIDIALGVYLIAYAQKPTIRFPISTKFIVLCLAGLATFSLFTEFLPSRLASGTFRYGRVEAPNIEYYQDGKTATVGVQINENGVGIISTNGKPDAGLRLDLRSEDPVEVVSDEITMAMLAAMPLLVKPDLKEVAAIGFGSGMTSHIVLTSPSVKVLDSIEIEPAMVEGAKLFKTRNNLAFDDPRSKIHFDDAKTFFAAQQKKYDVIISEPSNPWVIGVGNLFTKEFYSLMKRYLKDDGLLVQWLHLYEISTATLLTALSALDSEFQHYDLYTSVKGDIIIVASTRKSTDLSIKPSWDQLPPALRKELEIVELTSMDKIRARKIASKNEISALVKILKASYNSDYYPLLSLNAPKDRFKKATSFDILNLQTTGVNDSPYQNEYFQLRNVDLDASHPFSKAIEHIRNIENGMFDDKLEKLDIATIGSLQLIKNPKKFCGTQEGRTNWVSAFNLISRSANNFGSPMLRENLIDKAKDFECAADLEVTTGLLLKATLISLENLNAESRVELRNILENPAFKELHSSHRSFVISIFFINTINDLTGLTQGDVDLIEENKKYFNFVNQWLEGLLIDAQSRL